MKKRRLQYDAATGAAVAIAPATGPVWRLWHLPARKGGSGAAAGIWHMRAVPQRALFNRRVIQWSIILYIALLEPLSLLHEAGHALVCSSQGFTYSIWLDWAGGHTLCSSVTANAAQYGVMGGVFGLLGSAAIIASGVLAGNRRNRFYHNILLPVGLAYLVDQAAKAVLEGFFSAVYTSGAIDVFITVLQLASWMGLAFYFAHKPTLLPDNRRI